MPSVLTSRASPWGSGLLADEPAYGASVTSDAGTAG
jgi:hypothetical protein